MNVPFLYVLEGVSVKHVQTPEILPSDRSVVDS